MAYLTFTLDPEENLKHPLLSEKIIELSRPTEFRLKEEEPLITNEPLSLLVSGNFTEAISDAEFSAIVSC